MYYVYVVKDKISNKEVMPEPESYGLKNIKVLGGNSRKESQKAESKKRGC